MSNVVPFPPLAGAKVPRPSRHLAARFLERPPGSSHAVQFYDDHDFLLDTVAQFLVHGLNAGQSVLVIATAEHTDGLIDRLGKSRVSAALAVKQLVLADADAMLARFMVGGEISQQAFASTLDFLLRDLPDANYGKPLRAFGEMVDRLWQQGHALAAVQLEELWCKTCQDRPELSLLCSYSMGNFYKQDESPRFREVCQLHSHVLPTERFARADGGDFDRLREISLLEQRERLLQSEVFYREQLERTLRELSSSALPPAGALETQRESDAYALVDGAPRFAAHELIEPSAELIAIARTLLARYADRASADELLRLNAASDRLQRAVARLGRAEDDAPEASPRSLSSGDRSG